MDIYGIIIGAALILFGVYFAFFTGIFLEQNAKVNPSPFSGMSTALLLMKENNKIVMSRIIGGVFIAIGILVLIFSII